MGKVQEPYTENEQAFGELLRKIKEKRGYGVEKDSTSIEQSAQTQQPKQPNTENHKDL